MVGIYMIHNKVNNKVYIGQSVHIKKRWYEHKQELNKGCHHNSYLQAAWLKSPDDFEFVVLQECDRSELDELEIYYINEYHATDYHYGYNLYDGGKSGNRGRVYSDELKQYYSQAHDAEKIKVVCIETQDVVNGLCELQRRCGYVPSAIKHCCDYSFRYVHALSFDDLSVMQMVAYGYHWAYADDFEKYSDAYFAFVDDDVRVWQRKIYFIEKQLVFENANAASAALGLSMRWIYAVCRGDQKSTHGLHFCFYDDYLSDMKYYDSLAFASAKSYKRPVVCIETKEVFESAAEAARKYGVTRASIIAACSPNNRKKSCKGRHWVYKDVYDKNPLKYDALANQVAYGFKIRAVRCIETGEVFPNAAEAARKFNSCKQNILASCKKGWCAKGHHFEFYDVLNIKEA